MLTQKRLCSREIVDWIIFLIKGQQLECLENSKDKLKMINIQRFMNRLTSKSVHRYNSQAFKTAETASLKGSSMLLISFPRFVIGRLFKTFVNLLSFEKKICLPEPASVAHRWFDGGLPTVSEAHITPGKENSQYKTFSITHSTSTAYEQDK
jgi:hypothetical protein